MGHGELWDAENYLDLRNEWQFDTIGLPDRVTVIRLVGLCSWETMRLAILHEGFFCNLPHYICS